MTLIEALEARGFQTFGPLQAVTDIEGALDRAQADAVILEDQLPQADILRLMPKVGDSALVLLGEGCPSARSLTRGAVRRFPHATGASSIAEFLDATVESPRPPSSALG